MRKKKLLIALPLAIGLMIGSALYVRAAEGDGVLACADITSGKATYGAPKKDGPLGDQGWATPGHLEFIGTVTENTPTCLDVQYGIVVLEANPRGGVPVVLATGSAPGDGISNKFGFDLEISERAGESVCVYVYAIGSTGASTSGKTGAAFDGTSGGQMLDRGPDGGNGPDYCKVTFDDGGGGSSGYN